MYTDLFQVIPSISIKNGECVGLKHGDPTQRTEYKKQAFQVAQEFEKLGARFLHVTDIDGFDEGSSVNFSTIQSIFQQSKARIQLNAGIMKIIDLERYLIFHPWQVILSSMAVFDYPFIREVINRYGSDSLTILLDCSKGMVVARGWIEGSELSVEQVCADFKALGVKRLIVCDIERDGMATGANHELALKVKELTGAKVLISGGIASLEEINQIKNLGLEGVIIGRAFYENLIDPAQALRIK